MTVAEFYNKYAPMAEEVRKKYGVPVLSCLAQAALESGWGKNTPGNMMFGIKAGSSWTGQTQLLTTHEYVNGQYVQVKSKFRAYVSIYDSFLDYGSLLATNSRYKNAFKYDDPYLFSKEVAKAGYSTSSKYYDSISKIIDMLKKKMTKVI